VPDVPTYFNKVDFYGILLPGYFVIVVSLLLFRPDTLFGQQSSSFSLLPTVVFVVAGPVLGLALQQTQRMVLGNLWGRRSATKKKGYKSFMSEYHHVRLKSTVAERTELEQTEAIYDFNISSALGLISLGLSYLYFRGIGSYVPALLMLCAGGLLIVEGYFAWKTYGYIIRELIGQYPVAGE